MDCALRRKGTTLILQRRLGPNTSSSGPLVYNQAVTGVQQRLQLRVSELDI